MERSIPPRTLFRPPNQSSTVMCKLAVLMADIELEIAQLRENEAIETNSRQASVEFGSTVTQLRDRFEKQILTPCESGSDISCGSSISSQSSSSSISSTSSSSTFPSPSTSSSSSSTFYSKIELISPISSQLESQQTLTDIATHANMPPWIKEMHKKRLKEAKRKSLMA